jgi:hypothetical protein
MQPLAIENCRRRVMNLAQQLLGSLCAAGSMRCRVWVKQLTSVWSLTVASAGVRYRQPIRA